MFENEVHGALDRVLADLSFEFGMFLASVVTMFALLYHTLSFRPVLHLSILFWALSVYNTL